MLSRSSETSISGIAILSAILAVAFGLWLLIAAVVIGVILAFGGSFAGGVDAVGGLFLAGTLLLAFAFYALRTLKD